MLNRLPKATPCLSDMLADIGNPTPRALARALDVNPATVRRWISAGTAPQPALLALFWLTRWGRSSVDAEAHNAATMHAAHARELARELTLSRAQVARLRTLLDRRSDDAANSPLYGDELVRPVMESGSLRKMCQAMIVATT